MKFNTGDKRFGSESFLKVRMDFGVFAIAFHLKKLYKNSSKESFAQLFAELQLYVYRLVLAENQKKRFRIKNAA
jgi:hypothetical protein